MAREKPGATLLRSLVALFVSEVNTRNNNAAERALRAVAVGRKIWLFFQREGGGQTAVILLSLVMTAKAAGIDPKTYLRDILLRIAREKDVAKLTPHGWKQNFQAQVEKRRQAAIRAAVGI